MCPKSTKFPDTADASPIGAQSSSSARKGRILIPPSWSSALRMAEGRRWGRGARVALPDGTITPPGVGGREVSPLDYAGLIRVGENRPPVDKIGRGLDDNSLQWRAGQAHTDTPVGQHRARNKLQRLARGYRQQK